MKKITFATSCCNEEENVENLYARVCAVMDKFKEKYDFELIFADNASKDNTAQKLKDLAAKDFRVKVILNARNFGHIRSPYHAMVQGTGDAVIYLASDLQDPPELVFDFIKKWEEGFKIVLAKKIKSRENLLMFALRTFYYKLISKIADDDTNLVQNCTGFGLYDKSVMDIVKTIDDPYPYFRGLICEIGFDKAYVEFEQPKREKGITKNNFYTLYDNAMIGIVKHSKVPLRIMTFTGFLASFLSLAAAIVYLVWKLVYWDKFGFGLAPIIISMFFFASIQLFCMGILGEYIGAIYTRVNKKPVVVEKERINF